MRVRNSLIVLSLSGFFASAIFLLTAPIASSDEGSRPNIARSPRASASASGPHGRDYDPEDITNISLRMQACFDGNARYVLRDFAAAMAKYQDAIQLSPRHPLAHYLLGEAHLASGNAVGAEAAWTQAESLADSRLPALRARILFVLADFKERQRRFDEAKVAWNAYSEWTAKFADAGAFPGTAASRIQAIDTITKLDKEYEQVRERIRLTKDGGIFTNVIGDAAAGG